MVTVRLMERLWNGKAYGKIVREVMGARPEGSARVATEFSRPTPAAALLLIRLDELNQSFAPLYGKLVRTILNSQQADGSWGELATTALCLRALMCGGGDGCAVERGLAFLAAMQKDEGAWPNAPLRRMPADAWVTAFILLQLGNRPAFREAVRATDAMVWLEQAADADQETAQLTGLARLRCGTACLEPAEAHLWS